MKLLSERLFRLASYTIIAVLLCLGVFWIAEMFIPQGWPEEHPFYIEFLPSSIATFLGVMLGLFLERGWVARKEEERTGEMLTLVERELDRMFALAKPMIGNHLDIQVWDSMINSGDVSKLALEVQDRLFEFYSGVRAHNIETARLRELAEAYRRDRTDTAKSAWEEASRRLSLKEQNLVESIKQILVSGIFKEKAT